MQCIPQYNAENSVTNRLVKQLKKAGQNHFNILLTDVHQHQQLQQLERVPNALGAEEFPCCDSFTTQTNIECPKDGKIPQPIDVDRS